MLEIPEMGICRAPKSLRMCYGALRPLESVMCEENLHKLLILRYGSRGRGTSLSDVDAKQPQIPPLGLKSSVGRTMGRSKKRTTKSDPRPSADYTGDIN